MRKLVIGLLIFAAGWGLGWVMYSHRDSVPQASAPAVRPVPAKPPERAAVPPAVPPDPVDNIVDRLGNNAFDAAVTGYESLQARAGEVAAADARSRILSHARRLVDERRFGAAEQLLQRFLIAAYRDVEAHLLLAEAYHGQGAFRSAIDQLYEARGYAYRPAMLQQITRRIRSMVADRAQSLSRDNAQTALLDLYQHLVQLEPDHAPWFLQLATAQLALDDTASARRSLLLISQDPDVGARAQMLLAELDIALVEARDTAPRDSAAAPIGIPLHRSGGHYLVDAKPAPGRSIRLLIDTGASMTILTPAVLERPGIRYRDTGRTGFFNTANGPVRVPIYELATLAVGDWQVRHLEIGVLDLGERSGIDGLLGMNFLNRFRFFIDQNASVLRLSAND
ncbi:MAG: aspartyl protease family protein [Gammaproteobacteria bacterium]|jgi:clan AA aspartic protease (TIGR02281 family)